MKVVVNRCFGGFGLSAEAIRRYLELKGKPCFFYKEHFGGKNLIVRADGEEGEFHAYTVTKDLGDRPSCGELNDNIFSDDSIERFDPDLLAVVEKMGDEANGRHAKLEIVEIPDDVKWEISDYDGNEKVEECHRSW